MSSRDENGLQHGEGEVEAVNREEEAKCAFGDEVHPPDWGLPMA